VWVFLVFFGFVGGVLFFLVCVFFGFGWLVVGLVGLGVFVFFFFSLIFYQGSSTSFLP